MLFNSIKFLIFFPIVAGLYFIIPHKFRWIWLLINSYFFYMCWNPRYALLMSASTIITYLSGLLIHRSDMITDCKKRMTIKKFWVAASFISNLSILFFFKYFNFAVDSLNSMLNMMNFQFNSPSFDIILPVGISFYTFQALSYTMDVYREEIAPEKNIFRYALFVSFFPQLVAGPIERSKNLLSQLYERHYFDMDRIKRGFLLMMWGYFQKVVVADRAAIIVNEIFDHYEAYAGNEIILAAVLFAVQIYCDFSGYSDIAIGAAQIMGFRLMQNFRQPYFARSVAEFWRRWHISLTTWFRDYLYFPLGGSRVSRIKRYRNIMVVFLSSGLWHGASWNFVIWGGLNGLYQIFGDLTKPIRSALQRRLKIRTDCFSYRCFQTLITFALIDLSWIFFRAPDLPSSVGILRRLMDLSNPWIWFDQSLYRLGLERVEFWVMIVAILLLWFIDFLRPRMAILAFIDSQNLVFRWMVYIAAIWINLIFGVYGADFSASQFIYFQF